MVARPFTVDGVRYATAEHWMMAGKARLFGDAEAERRALAAAHPSRPRRPGGRCAASPRRSGGGTASPWSSRAAGTVRPAPAAAEFLLGTGSRVLVEASPVDRIWGIGLAADDDRAADPARWRGLNLLGFALMAARQELAAGGAV
ncbi:NADAR family protein [Streptomyces albulus]|nr:NADAR family protein [Streptomyces noursei]